MYRVKIEQFEGPLDLLLEIIEAKKLPLVEIALSKIVDQFVDYLDKLGERNLEQIVQFLVIASRLALLKSRELVPTASNETEEEGNLETLQRKLVLYQLFRQAAKELQKLDRRRTIFYSREAFVGFKRIFYFPPKLKVSDITAVLDNLLDTLTLPARIPQAKIKDNVSLAEVLKQLTKILKSGQPINFSDFLRKKEPIEKLINFLGVLELLRLEKINIAQNKNFGKITIQTLNPKH